MSDDRTLGARFRTLGVLGSGGTGTVLELAPRDRPDARIAAKVLAPELRADPAVRERFVREARIARELDHPGIIRVLELLDDAQRHDARVVLISTIVTHHDVHRRHMKRLDELARERGLREQLILIAGGTQVTQDLAVECGMDAGFGRGTTGQDAASFIVRRLLELEGA